MPADLDASIQALARASRRTGIFCDFDGSLAPIVLDPERARPARGTARVLHKLARRYGAVAIVSGRPVRFLARRLHARGVRMIGLYGIEERIGRHFTVLPEAQHARAAVDQAAGRLRAELASLAGVYVEHKGFAVSIHFRRAASPAAAQAIAEPVALEIASNLGLTVLMRGRLVLEIGPPATVDKGHVVRRIVEANGLTGALVVGDDIGDVPMYAAVEGLDPVLRVAVANDEVPPELFARADVSVKDPAEVVALLKRLADARGR
jgi:trehalose 6-phosphate phosphatase